MILSNAKHLVLITLFFIGYNAFSQLKVDRSSEEIKVAKSSAVFNPNVTYGTMTDQDGNEYKTVQIGNQIWMAENLRTTKYTDGTPIPMVSSGDWSKQTQGAYCTNENSTDPTLIATYGLLYNWHTIATGKIAPEGWRVPTNDDWAALAKAFGSKFTAGGKLKEAGTAHWKAPNKDASNESGFTSMPSGQITDYNRFMYFETQSFIWSATESSSTTAFYQSMSYVNDDLTQAGANKKFGHAIRLVKDAEGTASASGSIKNALVSDKKKQDDKFFNIKNRWKGTSINVENGLAIGEIAPGWHSAMWIFEPVEGYVRIKNRWKGTYLNVENGFGCTEISPGWHSAMWKIEPVEGTNYVKIKNRWKGTYINIENGLNCTEIDPGWQSAMWEIDYNVPK